MMTHVATVAPHWFHASAKSWDEATSLASNVYYPHSIHPIERHGEAELDFDMSVLQLDGLVFGRTRYGAAIEMECGDLDGYSINIPLLGRVDNVCGDSVSVADPFMGAVFNHSRRAVVKRSAASLQLALKLDRTLVERQLAALIGHEVTAPVMFEMSADLATAETFRWMSSFNVLRRALDEPMVLEGQPVYANQLRDLLVLGLLLGQRHNYSEELSSGGGSRMSFGVADRAVRLIKDEHEFAWTVATLAARVGVSARAVQDNFHRSIGMPPMQFLAEVRLELTHDELSKATADQTTVTTIAQRYGFSHLGRFAVSYRKRFGESPSKTLRSLHS